MAIAGYSLGTAPGALEWEVQGTDSRNDAGARVAHVSARYVGKAALRNNAWAPSQDTARVAPPFMGQPKVELEPNSNQARSVVPHWPNE